MFAPELHSAQTQTRYLLKRFKSWNQPQMLQTKNMLDFSFSRFLYLSMGQKMFDMVDFSSLSCFESKPELWIDYHFSVLSPKALRELQFMRRSKDNLCWFDMNLYLYVLEFSSWNCIIEMKVWKDGQRKWAEREMNEGAEKFKRQWWKSIKNLSCKNSYMFLAVQNSSIGDLVNHSMTLLLTLQSDPRDL